MAGYIGSQTPVVSNGSQRKYTFTATAAQTVFTGMDIPNPQQIQVFQNGVRLVITTDYTVSSGTTVTLVNAASAGDSLVVILFADYQLLDTDALTFTGGTTIEGGLTVDNDGATVLTVDRATSDGTIIDVQKNGSSVGSIGAKSGDIYIGTGDTGIRFNDGDNAVYAADTTTGGASDGNISLGVSAARFKDLYLSGGVYLGGTGAANKLDDYEEGTWTPAWTSVTNPSYTVQLGHYTKVGRLVTFHMSLQWNGGTSIGPNVGGLPFAVQNANESYFMSSTYNDAGITYGSGRTTLVAYPVLNQTYLQLNANGSAIAGVAPTIATGGALYATGFYYAA
jgi:hypothetical protein